MSAVWRCELVYQQSQPCGQVLAPEAISGERLNPRMTDLHCWRETFPERLRGQGSGAEATRQAMVGLLLGSGSGRWSQYVR